MAQTGDWERLGSAKEIYSILAPALGLLLTCFVLTAWRDAASACLFDLALAMIFLGIGPGVLFSRLDGWERSCSKCPRAFALIFLVGLLVLMGTALGSTEEDLTLFVAIALMFGLMLFLFLFQDRRQTKKIAKVLNKTQIEGIKTRERMYVETKGAYSLHLITEFRERIEGWLKEEDYHFKKDGNLFTVRAQEEETIELGLRDVNQLEARTIYVFTAGTTKSEGSTSFDELKQGLKALVSEMNTEKNLEFYSQVKSASCPDCGKKAYYYGYWNHFSCSCGCWKLPSQIDIETTEWPSRDRSS